MRDLSLSGAVFLDGELAGDWSVRSQMEPADFPDQMAPDARMISYHFIRQGPVRCRIEGGEEVLLDAGDLVVLTRNDAHFLSSGETVDAVDAKVAMGRPDDEGIHRVRLPGERDRRALYCGFLGGSDHPLLDALPALMVVRTKDHADWIERTFRLIVEDLRTASPVMVAQLAAGIFVEAVRRFVAEHHDGEEMLAALSDPVVGKTLSAIHADLAREIASDTLAAQVGVSRSVMMERFSKALGCGPTSYRNRLRLATAARALRTSDRPVSQIGFAAGYESEEGFSRAFKKAYGVSPSKYRIFSSKEGA
ncbi:AraC family transcriptional regulator [Sphingomicrobium arenosum]|uniref:AraC family transcriptional regulator n=1 Tax=Sphingomicrobium arenosum TaxID=2233861 RepID=UPI0022406527|nr:AraC family transcriptional regulator [Sphingomicrobium arenosum]